MSEQKDPNASSASGKKGGTILAVVAAVVMAAGGAFAGNTLVGPRVGQVLAADPSADGSGEEQQKKKDDHGGGYDDHGGSGAGEIEVHMIDNLIVNPAGSGASRFLLASIALLPGPSADVDALAARDIELRDAMVRLLGSKKVDELADTAGRTGITDEMKAVLDGLLGEGKVAKIYLPQWVIQ